MAFHNLGLKGAPLAKVISALTAEFSSCSNGTKVPPQPEAPKVFGCGSTQYMKALRQLRDAGVVTKVGMGLGYVTGKPSKEQVEAMQAERRARSRKLINNTRSAQCVRQGVATRELRKQVRDSLLQAIIKEGIEHHVVSALRDRDVNHMVCCEKALRMVGCSFEQSPEAQEMIGKNAATALGALASVAIAFRPATGPSDTIKAEYQEVEVDEN